LLYLPVDEVDEADDDEQHQYADSTSNERRVARCAVCKQHTLVAVSVCVTVRRLSGCLSSRSVNEQQRRAAGLLPSSGAGGRYWSITAVGAQPQRGQSQCCDPSRIDADLLCCEFINQDKDVNATDSRDAMSKSVPKTTPNTSGHQQSTPMAAFGWHLL